MHLPNLTALQARLAASLAASAVLVVLYLLLTQPQFAYAVELDSRIPPDHNHPILLEFEDNTDDEIASQVAGIQDGNLRSRAAAGVSALVNNAPQNLDIEPGFTQVWLLPKDVVNGAHGTPGLGLPSDNLAKSAEDLNTREELRKRQDKRTVYITINTCLQPSIGGDSGEVVPPQLELFMSQSPSNESPGPTTPDSKKVDLNGGYALYKFNTSDDVYVGVYAPNSTSVSGVWNYEIAGSIDAPFHSANETWSNLFFVDGDNHAALLITNDTTWTEPNSTVYQEWLHMNPPWGMFAHNQNDRSILGVRNSYCGLKNLAQISAGIGGVVNQNIAGMTNRGVYNKPKEQFWIGELNASSSYWGFLAMQGNSTDSGNDVVGGGGKVWAPVAFTTKTDNNCALLYNLSFCSEVAYAVPSNPNIFPPATGIPALSNLYDDNAKGLYQYFNYSLAQIPCNTTSTAQYSLARNCDDCAEAYKRWLCAVTIPRCEDFSNPAPWLRARNTAQPFINGSSIINSPQFELEKILLDATATNSSRNPIIDQDIRPGPYREVLPCIDLCFELVQSCPAALGFGCPYPGRGQEDSYGIRSSTESNNVTCSYLGAVYELNGAKRNLGITWGLLTVALVVPGVIVGWL